MAEILIKKLMFDRKIQKNCRFVRVTTSEFVLSVYKSIDSCKFKVVPEGGRFLSDFWGQGIRPNEAEKQLRLVSIHSVDIHITSQTSYSPEYTTPTPTQKKCL